MSKAIIVDDENKACQVLLSMIEMTELDVEVVKIINDPRDAKEQIESIQPDILFLDVDMPFMNGFDVLQSLETPDFEVIFVTGHDEYAIHAFKCAAAGYILKPIDVDDLAEAIKRAFQKLEMKESLDHNKVLLQNLSNHQDKKIGIPTMEGLDFISIEEIVRCEGVQKCTKVIISDGTKIISSYNIGEFVKLLSPYGFFSSHKSHLVNLDKIKKYYKEGTITMTDESNIPLARRRKQDFLSTITKLH